MYTQTKMYTDMGMAYTHAHTCIYTCTHMYTHMRIHMHTMCIPTPELNGNSYQPLLSPSVFVICILIIHQCLLISFEPHREAVLSAQSCRLW